MSFAKRSILLSALVVLGLVVARAQAEESTTASTAAAASSAVNIAPAAAEAPAAAVPAAAPVATAEPAKVAAKKSVGDESLGEMWERMTFGPRLIVIILLVFGVASLAVFFERLYALRRTRTASDAFAPEAEKLLDAKSYDALKTAADNAPKSHLAWLVGEGITAYVDGIRKPGAVTPVELARRAMEREMESVTADLKRGLSVLATVGSVAPFIGLLGTVVGIIAAFKKIGITGSAGLDTVAGDISEALVVTALGLVIAIPAVLLFNILTAKIDAATMVLDHARGELNDQLETGHAVPHSHSHDKHAAAEGAFVLGKAGNVRPA